MIACEQEHLGADVRRAHTMVRDVGITTWVGRGAIAVVALLACVAPSAAIELGPDDWPAWRGQYGNGVAVGALPPLVWSEESNVLWKTPVPGRGHGSPTVVGSRVFLPTTEASQRVQAVLAFDRATGKPLWRRDVIENADLGQAHGNNTHATPTIASDGTHLFAVFHHGGSVEVLALDLAGQLVWRRTVGPYQSKFGYAASPVVHGDCVIVVADSNDGSWLAALDRATGDEKWRMPRKNVGAFSSPVAAHVAGRTQLLISGGEQVVSYDPASGQRLWSTQAITSTTCGTIVWDGDLVFASGGHPGNETAGIRADGSGEVVWRNGVEFYEPSMLAHNGYLYGINKAGVAHCWRAADGEKMWRSRLATRGASASPVMIGDRIYISNEAATTFVFSADPAQFKLFATNQLGDDAFATLSICGGRIYLRGGHGSREERQEILYCVGEG